MEQGIALQPRKSLIARSCVAFLACESRERVWHSMTLSASEAAKLVCVRGCLRGGWVAPDRRRAPSCRCGGTCEQRCVATGVPRELVRHFCRNADGSWTCVSPATLAKLSLPYHIPLRLSFARMPLRHFWRLPFYPKRTVRTVKVERDEAKVRTATRISQSSIRRDRTNGAVETSMDKVHASRTLVAATLRFLRNRRI